MRSTDIHNTDYKKRFNKMYELGLDLTWFDKKVPKQIRTYIKYLVSTKQINFQNSKLLEIGCGRGVFLSFLEKAGFKKTIGVDVSEVAIEFAKERVKSSQIKVEDVIKGLSFSSEEFDLAAEITVLSSLNPHLWPNILKEISRVLKTNGHFISEIFVREENESMYIPQKNDSNISSELDQVYGVSRSELIRIISKNFKIEKCLPISPESGGSFFVLAKKLS
jgi:ubiquinone/menaquinone biosynthesis C-methylase UbiE